jgi:hypothetical protein
MRLSLRPRLCSALCLAWLAAQPGGTVHAQPPPTPVPSPAPAPAHKPTLSVSGFLQVQYTDPIDANDDGTAGVASFSSRRVRIRVKGQVLEDIGYTIMIDPSTPGNLLRDGFISLGLVPHHEIRLGQQKTQFGYENVESSTRLYQVNRALVSDALGRGPDARDLGIGVLGAWSLPGQSGLEYGLTLVNGAGPNVARDDTERKNFWGRVGGRTSAAGDAVKLWLGASFARGDQLDRGNPADPADDFVVDFRRVGLDARAETRWFFAAGEWISGSNEEAHGDRDAWGAYLMLVGKTPLHLGPILRWELYDPDRNAAGNELRRITFGAYYDLRPVNVRLMANYELDASEARRDDAFLLFGQILF